MIVKRWIVCHRAKGADLKVIGLPVDQSRIILSLFQWSKPGECCAVITLMFNNHQEDFVIILYRTTCSHISCLIFVLTLKRCHPHESI